MSETVRIMLSELVRIGMPLLIILLFGYTLVLTGLLKLTNDRTRLAAAIIIGIIVVLGFCAHMYRVYRAVQGEEFYERKVTHTKVTKEDLLRRSLF